MKHSSLSSSHTSPSCDLLAVLVGVGGKGAEDEICRKTLCTERVTHPLFGPFIVGQINVRGNTQMCKQIAPLTENDDK